MKKIKSISNYFDKDAKSLKETLEDLIFSYLGEYGE